MSILNKVLKKKEDAAENDRKIEKAPKNIKKETAVEKNEESHTGMNKKMNENAYKILLRPVITEKTAVLNKENKYIFEVDPNVNKVEIKKAIQEVYGIMPLDVNIMPVKGKKVGTMRKNRGKRKDWKKAIVTLKKGESIQIYEATPKK